MSLDRKINRIQFLSGKSLKVIAVLTMLIDHLCKIVLQWLLSNYWGLWQITGKCRGRDSERKIISYGLICKALGRLLFRYSVFCWQKDSNTQEVKNAILG